MKASILKRLTLVVILSCPYGIFKEKKKNQKEKKY
jgi:hypothetical protein